MKRLLLILLSALLSFSAFSQDDANIAGHVLDAATGEHLAFITVQLKGTSSGCQTDETGHYFLTNLSKGEHTLVFSSVGYKTVERKVSITNVPSTYELNVELEEEVISLDNVVVTANRYETRQKDIATIVNVIPPQLFETTTASCIADVLGYQTGLRVEQTCANCGQKQVRINGLDGQYSQILMDSRPIFSSLAAVYGLEQIPVGMVDRVEVVRGGTSAMYGSNAIGGVVNIITREPTHNFVRVSNASSMLRTSAYDINTTLNAGVVSGNQKMGVFLFAVQRNRKQYDHDSDGFSDIPKLSSTTAGFRGFFKTSAYSKIVAEYHHVTDFRRGGNRFDEEPFNTDITEQARHNIDAGNLNFNWFTQDNKHHLNIYTGMQNISRDSYYGADYDPNAYGHSHDLTSVSGVQYRWAIPKFGIMPADFSAGAEYTYNSLTDDIKGYDRHLSQTVHTYGGYVQNEWKNEQWSALIGVRVEKHNLLKMPVAMPRANLRYSPVEWIILRTGYSSGYRAPQAYDEDLHVSAVGGEVSLIELDPQLKPERSHSVNISTDWYFSRGDWQANLLLEGFYTRLNDVFFLQEKGRDAQNNLLLMRTNASGAQVAGLNVEGKAEYKHIVDLQLGYTFQKSEYIEAQTWSEDADIIPQKRMFRTPEHYAFWLLNINPLKDFVISINGKVTGSMLVQHYAGYVPKDEEKLTPWFCEIGIKLAYDIHLYKLYCLQVNIGVKNALNQFQSDLDKGSLRDASYIYGPSIPRTWFAGISLDI